VISISFIKYSGFSRKIFATTPWCPTFVFLATKVRHFQACNSFQAKNIFTQTLTSNVKYIWYFQMFNDYNFQIGCMDEDGATYSCSWWLLRSTIKYNWIIFNVFIPSTIVFLFFIFHEFNGTNSCYFLFLMKCGSPNVWKVDQIWQLVRLSQGSYHYVLCISIGESPENKILFSYSQLLGLYTSK
jgi:hypothetical protein